MLTFNSIVIAYFFLEETLPSKVLEKKLKLSGEALLDAEARSYGAVDTRSRAAAKKPPTATSARTLLANPRVQMVILAGFFLSLIATSYDTVFVLWAYTPATLGGLQRTPGEIGTLLSSVGLLGVFVALLGFPFLQRRFGTLPLYRTTMAVWPVIFVLLFVLSTYARAALPRPDGSPDPSVLSTMYIGVGIVLATGRLANMSFSAQQMTVKAAAPNPESLGAMFGFAQTMSSVARAMGPAFVSSLFAFSVDRQILKGQLVWLVMFIIALAGLWSARRL